MAPWLDLLQPLQEFMDSGGYVLWGIALVSVLLWTLIIERYVYLRLIHPGHLQGLRDDWQRRSERRSWFAQQIHRAMLSEVSLRLSRFLSLIRALVAVCPLLGLLGTVTGMIHVFDVLAIQGGDNARALAAGISMATTPTMAGMVVALSGLFFSSRLQHHAARELRRAAEQLSALEHAGP